MQFGGICLTIVWLWNYSLHNPESLAFGESARKDRRTYADTKRKSEALEDGENY